MLLWSCREKELSRQPCGWPDQHSNIPFKLNTMLTLNEASLSSNHTLSPSMNGKNTSPEKKFILIMLPSFSLTWGKDVTVQASLKLAGMKNCSCAFCVFKAIKIQNGHCLNVQMKWAQNSDSKTYVNHYQRYKKPRRWIHKFSYLNIDNWTFGN